MKANIEVIPPVAPEPNVTLTMDMSTARFLRTLLGKIAGDSPYVSFLLDMFCEMSIKSSADTTFSHDSISHNLRADKK